MIRSVLHFEILNDANVNLLNYFQRLNFDLVGSKYSSPKNGLKTVKQSLLRSNQAQFVLTNHHKEPSTPTSDLALHEESLNTLAMIKARDERLFQRINQRRNTVFNMALEVGLRMKCCNSLNVPKFDYNLKRKYCRVLWDKNIPF